MNGTQSDWPTKSTFVRSAKSQEADRTQIISDSLVPATIALVCGTLFVLACFVTTYALLQKLGTRMRGKRGREPELLSYCSTVDSYRAGIIGELESRRDVRDFLAKVLDGGLSSTRGLFSALRPAAGANKPTHGTRAGRDPESSTDSARSPSRPDDSRHRISVPECRPRVGSAFPGRDTRRSDNSRSEDESGRRSRRSLAADPIYEEIEARLDGRLYDRTAPTATGSTSDVGDSDHPFGDRHHDAGETVYLESGASLCTIQTNSSWEAEPSRWRSALGNPADQLHVISLSELSINIRSCPDSPLCGVHPLPEARRIVDASQRRCDDPVDGASLPVEDDACAVSFSTTILDMVQGEARKRGLVDDSLVRDSRP